DSADIEDIVDLAGLFSRNEFADAENARLFSEGDLTAIGELAKKWAGRLLACGTASRWQKATIASLISHAPSAALLRTLKALLDDNLRLYREAREKLKATNGRDQKALYECQHPCMLEEVVSRSRISSPATDRLPLLELATNNDGDEPEGGG